MRTPSRTADLPTLFGALNNTANIIMQLSMPGVGYGVQESRVDSGNAFVHPIKRARTTGAYLAVAIMGTDADRAVLHREIAQVHARVHSTPQSPVRYSGNDSRLQLWVAACLYRYFVDQFELVYGPLTRQQSEQIYADAAVLGTTLNVRPDQWPADLDAFERYWSETVPTLRIDPPVRDHLRSIATLDFLTRPLGMPGRVLKAVLGRPYLFMTIATLPPEFRELMGFDWTAADERTFRRVATVVSAADRLMPHLARLELWTFLIAVRARTRLGMSVL
ncbi:oxygenase MpaB family protein [Gordonia soli]|uniref:ER-bound oxygenase mpaB/mpaB'/Rubber oxygenase catalytic domain-containing protein n=1 Tax=Gordonia soli NBRC 108243 TaxID=1223545 RepID=M0QHT9_9ACTN|nr:oxygenase MpaB family protein [Gordonia soli]GAC66982.1 hypothetical protein GS4_05_01950 [Gordonia soli NBRC 108243]